MNRHVSAIYCDDIRQEIGNKQSYIGVYHGKLLVPQFPFTLPKLCVVLTVFTPMTQPFKQLGCKIFKDELLLADSPIEQNIIRDQNKIIEEHNPDVSEMFIALNMAFTFSPFSIEGPTKIRVRVQTEDQELKGQSLLVETTT